MKTVMKKMFCLMLVAVLMVGVMPFQAFAVAGAPGQEKDFILVAADPGTWTEGVNYIHVVLDSTGNIDSAAYSALSSAAGAAGIIGWTYDGYGASSGLKVADLDLGDSRINVYPVFASAPPKCATCGNDEHSGVCCSKCKVTGHADVNHCAHPGCGSLDHLATDHCAVCGALSCDGLNHCTVCNQPGHTAALHCSVCGVYGCAAANHCGVCADKAHATANCPYCAVCYAKGDKYVTSHATAAHCTTCDTVNGHKAGYPCYTAPQTGSYSLNVWAKLWVGETLQKTILLDTITGLNGNEVVPYVISDHRGRLESKFPSGYNNIEWTKAVYYEIDSKTTGTVDTKMKVAEEGNVFINLYSTEKLVVVRVHTGKTYNVDRSVQVGGFRVGETVTYNDVLKAVQKYYNVSSMKMYTYGEWEKVVHGGNGATTPNFLVHEGDNVYEVYLTGSAKTSTTASNKKADSTNPKTGDTIYAPVMIMGASVSALAVLYYLNKKRAF